MDYLSAIGRLKSDVEKAQSLNTPLEAFMVDVGNQFTNVMIDFIVANKANANGALIQGLKGIPVRDEQGVSIPFTSEAEYTNWRNDGVSGTITKYDTPYSFKNDTPSSNMVKSMDEWIRAKGYDADDGDFESFAYATSVMVKRFGIEPLKFIEHTFSESNMKEFEEALLTLTEQYVTGQFTKIIPNLR